MKQDLDLMIESFLSENTIEDQGFSQKVVSELPKRTVLHWLQDAFPAFALGVFLLVGWHYHFLIEQSFFLYKSEFYSWCVEKLGTVSLTVSYSTLIGLGFVMVYILFDKMMDIAESF